jgi:hypothetical protein
MICVVIFIIIKMITHHALRDGKGSEQGGHLLHSIPREGFSLSIQNN